MAGRPTFVPRFPTCELVVGVEHPLTPGALNGAYYHMVIHQTPIRVNTTTAGSADLPPPSGPLSAWSDMVLTPFCHNSMLPPSQDFPKIGALL